MPGLGFVWFLRTPRVQEALCHPRTPQQPHATQGNQGGHGLLPPKTWPGHHPGLQGSSHSPLLLGSVSGSSCLQGSSFSQLPALLPLSKLSQQEMLDAPLQSTTPLLFLPQPTEELAQHLGVICGSSQVRPAALPGSRPGHEPQPCSGALTSTPARRHPGGSHAAPQGSQREM